MNAPNLLLRYGGQIFPGPRDLSKLDPRFESLGQFGVGGICRNAGIKQGPETQKTQSQKNKGPCGKFLKKRRVRKVTGDFISGHFITRPLYHTDTLSRGHFITEHFISRLVFYLTQKLFLNKGKCCRTS